MGAFIERTVTKKANKRFKAPATSAAFRQSGSARETQILS